MDTSIGDARVCRVIDQICAERSVPEVVILGNGPEYSGLRRMRGPINTGCTLHFIQP